MGRKQNQNEKKEEPKAVEEKTDEEVEESPVVKTLEEIDNRYLALEKEYEKEVHKLRMRYEKLQQPLLDERTEKLLAGDDQTSGTPGLPGFWVKALKNSYLTDFIQDWDEDVLMFLKDITKEEIDEEDPDKGFRIKFHFRPHSWFDHETLTVEVQTEAQNPYNQEDNVLAVKCDPEEIQWKPGKDVTVEKVAKKVKGGGAKKAKQKKEKEEPRESFFRLMFRNVKKDDELPDDIQAIMAADADEDDDDAEAETEDYLSCVHEQLQIVKDQIIPFAVRWYTGEASPEDDDDDFDEDEEEEEEDDEDDDSEDDSPKGKGKGKGKMAKKKPGKSPKDSPATGPAAEPKKEECKQQ